MPDIIDYSSMETRRERLVATQQWLEDAGYKVTWDAAKKKISIAGAENFDPEHSKNSLFGWKALDSLKKDTFQLEMEDSKGTKLIMGEFSKDEAGQQAMVETMYDILVHFADFDHEMAKEKVQELVSIEAELAELEDNVHGITASDSIGSLEDDIASTSDRVAESSSLLAREESQLDLDISSLANELDRANNAYLKGLILTELQQINNIQSDIRKLNKIIADGMFPDVDVTGDPEINSIEEARTALEMNRRRINESKQRLQDIYDGHSELKMPSEIKDLLSK